MDFLRRVDKSCRRRCSEKEMWFARSRHPATLSRVSRWREGESYFANGRRIDEQGGTIRHTERVILHDRFASIPVSRGANGQGFQPSGFVARRRVGGPTVSKLRETPVKV